MCLGRSLEKSESSGDGHQSPWAGAIKFRVLPVCTSGSAGPRPTWPGRLSIPDQLPTAPGPAHAKNALRGLFFVGGASRERRSATDVGCSGLLTRPSVSPPSPLPEWGVGRITIREQAVAIDRRVGRVSPIACVRVIWLAIGSAVNSPLDDHPCLGAGLVNRKRDPLRCPVERDGHRGHECCASGNPKQAELFHYRPF